MVLLRRKSTNADLNGRVLCGDRRIELLYIVPVGQENSKKSADQKCGANKCANLPGLTTGELPDGREKQGRENQEIGDVLGSFRVARHRSEERRVGKECRS